ncbi:MAG TPA: hypothetical protein VJ697_06725 [Nitrososphaeraceae archaeon]|nr:hypothetical protein [Nitrososphaeraceae archaeon]
MTTNLQHFREKEIYLDCDPREGHNYKLVIVKNNKHDSYNFNNLKKEDVVNGDGTVEIYDINNPTVPEHVGEFGAGDLSNPYGIAIQVTTQ